MGAISIDHLRLILALRRDEMKKIEKRQAELKTSKWRQIYADRADGLDLTSAFRESNPKTTLTRRSYELDRGRSALLGAAPTAHNPDGPIPLLDASICLDCNVIFKGNTCPTCASKTTFPVSRWLNRSTPCK